MKRDELTARIAPPTYKVGRYRLNEYEVREMMARIAEGKLSPDGIKLIDGNGGYVTFNNKGKASRKIKGLDTADIIAMRHWKKLRELNKTK